VGNENESVNEFTGRTVVVTGANSGIGLAAAEAFARGGARVAIVGRDQARLDEALSRVREAAGPDGGDRVAAYRADFTSFDQVRALAATLRQAYPSIDVLANNAGGVFKRRTTTADGFETTIQANHLAPFLLTHLLQGRLAGGRVINTASDAHRMGRLDPAALNSPGAYRAFPVYGTSKQANILFAAEAARQWPQISSFSYHPGVVRSRFGREQAVVTAFYRVWPFLRTPEQGADTMVWLAGAPLSQLESGGYYVDRHRRSPTAAASNPQTAASLWTASEAAVGLT
jgi:NAD(P)-dependent dehydrogenase (short-subunit alcohol dehydrogenase family)